MIYYIVLYYINLEDKTLITLVNIYCYKGFYTHVVSYKSNNTHIHSHTHKKAALCYIPLYWTPSKGVYSTFGLLLFIR